MLCSQCQGIDEVFSQEYVERRLKDYRRKGPASTTRMLVDDITSADVAGLSLLDIGGGVGAIQHRLLEAGVTQATHVDASRAFLEAAKSEAQQRGLQDRLIYRNGNFVDLAKEIDPADVVTLDRVICCYPDMDQLVQLSVERARKIYGLVYPRHTWWLKAAFNIGNFFLHLRHSAFRVFCHPTMAVEEIIRRNGFKQRSHRQTLVWQVVVYER